MQQKMISLDNAHTKIFAPVSLNQKQAVSSDGIDMLVLLRNNFICV